MIQDDIKSNELDGAELLHEWEEEGPISDMGIPHPVIIRIYLKDNTIYMDEIVDAPWQIGGNSGQVRPLWILTEDEYYELVRDKK